MAKKNLAIGHESFKKRFSASLFIGTISITGLSACSQGLSFAGFGKKGGGSSSNQANDAAAVMEQDAAAAIKNISISTSSMNDVLGAIKNSPTLFNYMSEAPITDVFRPDRFQNIESVEIDGVEIPNLADWKPYFEEMDRQRAAEYPTFQSYLDTSDIKSVEDIRAQIDPEVLTEVAAILLEGPEALMNESPAEEVASDSSSIPDGDVSYDGLFLGSAGDCFKAIFHLVGDVVGGAASCVGALGPASMAGAAETIQDVNTLAQTSFDAGNSMGSGQGGGQVGAQAGADVIKKGIESEGSPGAPVGGSIAGGAAAGAIATATTPESGCTYAGHHVSKGGCVGIAIAESLPCAGGFIKAGDDGTKMVGPEGCGRHRHHQGLRLRGYRR